MGIDFGPVFDIINVFDPFVFDVVRLVTLRLQKFIKCVKRAPEIPLKISSWKDPSISKTRE